MDTNKLYEKIEKLEQQMAEIESMRGFRGFIRRAFTKTSVVTGAITAALLTGVVLYAAQITFQDGDVISADDVNSNFSDLYAAAVPVGSITAWHKSMSGTPALPAGWVECNGQTISDSESPYNGMVVPNLNSTNRLLRGNTTSGATNTLGAHTHSIDPPNTTSSSTGSHNHLIGQFGFTSATNCGNHNHGGVTTGSGGTYSTCASHSHNITFPNRNTQDNGVHTHDINIAAFNSASAGGFLESFDVVWIIRIK